MKIKTLDSQVIDLLDREVQSSPVLTTASVDTEEPVPFHRADIEAWRQAGLDMTDIDSICSALKVGLISTVT